LQIHSLCEGSPQHNQLDSAGPGGTRDEIRPKEAKRVATRRADNAKERDRTVETRVELQTRNLHIQEGLARESILSSRKKRECATVSNLKKKLKMIERHKGMVDELLHALLTAGEEDKTMMEANHTTNNVEDRGGDAASTCD